MPPDVIERPIDDIDLAKEFLAPGTPWFRFKIALLSHGGASQGRSKAVPGISTYGALVLKHSVSRLNPAAVELAGYCGVKIVWMPAVDASK